MMTKSRESLDRHVCKEFIKSIGPLCRRVPPLGLENFRTLLDIHVVECSVILLGGGERGRPTRAIEGMLWTGPNGSERSSISIWTRSMRPLSSVTISNSVASRWRSAGHAKRGVVAAASYEARKFGVRSAMPSVTAKRKCPELTFVKPRFDVYRAVSHQIRAVFAKYTPFIEPLSLDEAYFDVTENLKAMPSATEIAEEVRARIRSETGLTASAGVSYNKFLAKMASDERKPDGLFVITPEYGAGIRGELAGGEVPRDRSRHGGEDGRPRDPQRRGPDTDSGKEMRAFRSRISDCKFFSRNDWKSEIIDLEYESNSWTPYERPDARVPPAALWQGGSVLLLARAGNRRSSCLGGPCPKVDRRRDNF